MSTFWSISNIHLEAAIPLNFLLMIVKMHPSLNLEIRCDRWSMLAMSKMLISEDSLCHGYPKHLGYNAILHKYHSWYSPISVGFQFFPEFLPSAEELPCHIPYVAFSIQCFTLENSQQLDKTDNR